MQRTIKAVFFDHDGTLVDSETTHLRIWQEVLQPYGVTVTQEHYERHYAGMTPEGNAADMARRFGLDVDPALLVERKETLTREHVVREPFPLMPGALESIRQLKDSGLRLAVVTGARRYGVDATVRGHALAEHFQTVVSADEVPRSKPAPDCYRLALQHLNVGPEECVAFEDTEHGLAAANGAGITCVAVPTPMSLSQDFALAEDIVDNLDQATRWVVSRL
ncbi:MAG TPA: HAD family phosphatase [Gammaproteobacteria bacterium]|nr:HAD family phosphatase [Gammaproteobacteria bacterium]